MKICIISDTHARHRQLQIPQADMIICAGDITFKGELTVIQDFADWMNQLPIQHKVMIFGNHELGIEHSYKRPQALQILEDANITYLEESFAIIEGIKIYGSPITPFFHNWEWNRHRGAEIKKHWDKIPNDTQVLITHGPPYNILDEVPLSPFEERDVHQGCEELAKRVAQLPNLKLHCFGHLHSGYGQVKIGNTIFANGAVCTEAYVPSNPPLIVEI